MLIVADSSPLNHLIRIGHVGVVPVLFGRAAVPPAVVAEMSDPRAPEAVKVFIRAVPAWLSVQAPSAIEPIPTIDPGEEAAISLARELKAELLLIDDRRGRQAAAARNLAIIGTVGVLERAGAEGLLDLRDAFERLRSTDHRLHAAFLDERLRLYTARQARQGRSSA